MNERSLAGNTRARGQSVSTYDHSRLGKSREERGDPPVVDSLKHTNWEHQIEAQRLGYPGVLHYVVDQLVAEVRALSKRVAELEDR